MSETDQLPEFVGTGYVISAFDRYRKLKNLEAALQAELKTAYSELFNMLPDNSTLTYEHRPLLVKRTVHGTRVDLKALRTGWPEVADACMVSTEVTSMRFLPAALESPPVVP